LPAILQWPMVYWTVAVSFGTVCFAKTFPPKWRTPFVTQCTALLVSTLIMLGFVGYKSIIFALGAGMICSALSTTFYDFALSALEAKVRAFFGISSQPDSPTVISGSSSQSQSTQTSNPK